VVEKIVIPKKKQNKASTPAPAAKPEVQHYTHGKYIAEKNSSSLDTLMWHTVHVIGRQGMLTLLRHFKPHGIQKGLRLFYTLFCWYYTIDYCLLSLLFMCISYMMLRFSTLCHLRKGLLVG
jgi:hypothetical protein